MLSECPLSVFMLPDIVGQPSRCHFLSGCTTIECCTDIPYLRLTLHTYLTIDPCGYGVKIGINSLQKTISLFNYERGKSCCVKMCGPHKAKKIICLVLRPCRVQVLSLCQLFLFLAICTESSTKIHNVQREIIGIE